MPVEREHRRALPRGESGHGAASPGGHLGCFDLLLRAGSAVDEFSWQGLHGWAAKPTPSHVERDARIPGAESLRRMQALEADQRRNRGLLHGVGGKVFVAQ